MTPEAFAEGLTRIGLALRQAPDAATTGVYFDSLRHQVTAEEWDRFARWAVDTDRFPRYFPKLSELRDALREFRGARPLSMEATAAYERVLGAGTYTPGGTTWIYREIASTCGDAAAEAFLAAGGHSAFATTWNETERRERFVAAYCGAVRDDPATALLPPGQAVHLLPAPAAPGLEHAADILRAVARRAGDAEYATPVAVQRPYVVEATPERLERLAAQAREIVADSRSGA